MAVSKFNERELWNGDACHRIGDANIDLLRTNTNKIQKRLSRQVLPFQCIDRDRGQQALVPQVNPPPPEIPRDEETAKTESCFSVSSSPQWGQGCF